MTLRILTLMIISGLLLGSCEKEFDPTGEWEENYAAYCLLNLKDSVQYVRVNRVFLSSDDPSQYFQVPDSVNVSPDRIEVSLFVLNDGIEEDGPVMFVPTDEFPKDDGLFSSENYYVYKSNFPLLPDRTYRLVIRNRETGFEMQAETPLLGRRPLDYSYKETRFYNITQYYPESIDYEGSLITSQYQKRVVRLLYYEIYGDVKVKKYLDWRSPYTKSSEDFTEDTAQLSDDLLRYFAENIPVDPGVNRIAVGVDRMLVLNDEKVTLYIGSSSYSSPGQFVTDMTNFDRGTGLFASRYYYTYFAVRLKPQTLDTLAYGRFTKLLRFADSQGNWPPL